MLLEQCDEETSLMRFFLKFGKLETTLRAQMPQLCKLLGIKAVRFGEKRVTLKSRLPGAQLPEFVCRLSVGTCCTQHCAAFVVAATTNNYLAQDVAAEGVLPRQPRGRAVRSP